MENSSVDEQKNSLQELSSSFLHNLIVSSVDAVIAADRKGKILIFNDAASEFLGYSQEEVLDHFNIRDIYPGDTAREIMKKLKGTDHGGPGKLKSYNCMLLTKTGEEVPIKLNASIIYDGNEEVATIGFFHDLRDDLQIQRKLEDTQLQLVQAEKMASLGKLAAGVAHQVNNPLNSITLFTRLVLDEYELQKETVADLTRVLFAAERCKDIIKELLEFARQTTQNILPLDINKAILRTLFLLEDQSLFQNIEIEKNLSEKLPLVPVDRRQINHVFMNIILNAAEAIEGSGKIIVRTYLKSSGDYIRIEISDTGPGIPEDIIDHIFEPFFTTKEEGKGTGLGLSVVYGIVQNHKGRMWADSENGKGTTFCIELPLELTVEGSGEDGSKD